MHENFMAPVFDSRKVTVIFVLGGPGVGKGTQCAKLVKEFGFRHLSAGDLLRAEQQREGSEFSHLIQDYIKQGQIVPMEITIKLLENAMKADIKGREDGGNLSDKKGRFLVDGFPRKMDQALKFEEEVCPSTLVIFFTATEENMMDRLKERSKTSGREDDNEESILKRFRTYYEQTMPVIDYFESMSKIIRIDSNGAIEVVYGEVSGHIKRILSEKS